VLTGKKISFVGGSHYIITYDTKNFIRKDPNCIGKLRASLGLDKYNLFDQGENPKATPIHELIRTQHASMLIVQTLITN